MFTSHKNKKILSLVVGIVGLVTIVGLSDLMFVLPQRQRASEPEAAASPAPAAEEAPYATTTASTTANQ
jgi:flagellar basal body-associated protein FliL